MCTWQKNDVVGDKMKNAVIFGDSYSTFRGYIPEGNAEWYSENPNPEQTDVSGVEETWWHMLAEEAHLNIILNDSWSGSTICHTGYNGVDCSATNSFICRLRKHIANGFFKQNKIDIVFIFGGTNDSWADAPMGEVKFDNFAEEDLFSVLPATAYFIKMLREQLPDAEIYCLANTDLKPEIPKGMAEICKKHNAKLVEFDWIGKTYGHPNIKGMQDIKSGVLKAMNEQTP